MTNHNQQERTNSKSYPTTTQISQATTENININMGYTHNNFLLFQWIAGLHAFGTHEREILPVFWSGPLGPWPDMKKGKTSGHQYTSTSFPVCLILYMLHRKWHLRSPTSTAVRCPDPPIKTGGVFYYSPPCPLRKSWMFYKVCIHIVLELIQHSAKKKTWQCFCGMCENNYTHG